MRQSSSPQMNLAESSDGYHLDKQYIVLLQLMIQYEFETRKFPNPESIALYEYLRQHELLADVTWHQLKLKIWSLREIYLTNVRKGRDEPFFTNPSPKYRFELSKRYGVLVVLKKKSINIIMKIVFSSISKVKGQLHYQQR